MSIAYGMADLVRFRNKFRNPDSVLRSIAKELVPVVRELIDEEFDEESGPEGPWKARKKNQIFTPILQRSGALRASFRVRVEYLTLVLSNTKSYFDYIQKGTRKSDARPILPVGNIPLEWKTRFDNVVRSRLDNYYK